MAGTLIADTLSNGISTADLNNISAGTAKAWCGFNGTGTLTIRKSYNVSSVTDVGVGIYRLNFTTVFPDSNYVVNASMGTGLNPGATADNDAYCHLGEHLPESFTLYVESAADASYDRAYVSVVIFN